ncbi:DUF6602 domain-containing protein [Microbispora rosea]|uniref:DUF6602 domain-containing protein n=1 Tax=Microbispora rosea TaxID=58117 RepID=UPI003680C679
MNENEPGPGQSFLQTKLLTWKSILETVVTFEKNPLPDTSSWQPTRRAGHPLERAFFTRCFELEEILKLKARNERLHNLHNFESGPAVEELIRHELAAMLPARYAVRAGHLIDRYGADAGDCDVIIFNDLWFSHALTGPTADSRRAYYPIDGAYAVLEIKQTLSESTLDDAMKKLVACHRLERPLVPRDRVNENSQTGTCTHHIRNPLFSAIVAIDIAPETRLQRLVERFFYTNKTLKRLEIVRGLCVLGHGTVGWGYFDENGDFSSATFMREDLYEPILPAFKEAGEPSSALYYFLVTLLGHLYSSVLGAEDIAGHYGLAEHRMSGPIDVENHAINPDEEWLNFRDQPCSHEGIRKAGPHEPYDYVWDPFG